MEYDEAIRYIMERCKGLDLQLIKKEEIIAEMKPKEKAAV